eukprot:Gb_21350 [translate_table: standard]
MATLLMQTQDLPLVPEKIKGESEPQRGLGSGSGRCRSRKVKNGVKKQPQRGLGVAQLEKLRLQEESKQEYICNGALGLPEVTLGSKELKQNRRIPSVGLDSMGLLQGWSQSPINSVTFMQLDPCRLSHDDHHLGPYNHNNNNNNTNPSHGARSSDILVESSFGYKNLKSDRIEPMTCSPVLKTPFLLRCSQQAPNNDLQIKGYPRTFKDGDLYPSMYLMDTNGLISGSEDQKARRFSAMKVSGSANVMSFADVNPMDQSPVRSADASRPLRSSQVLPLHLDGSQSIGDSSEELSSFQKYTCNTAWYQPEKKPGRKRSWDAILSLENQLSLGLSIGPSNNIGHQDGAQFGSEIQGKYAVASTTENSFLSLNGHRHCSPDRADSLKEDGAAIHNNFLALSLATSALSTEDNMQSEEVQNMQEENEYAIHAKESSDHCIKCKNSFNSFQLQLDHQAATPNLLSCQDQLMAQSKRRLTPTFDTASKKKLWECLTASSNEQNYMASASSLSSYNVKTGHQEDQCSNQIICSPWEASQLNLSLELSL